MKPYGKRAFLILIILALLPSLALAASPAGKYYGILNQKRIISKGGLNCPPSAQAIFSLTKVKVAGRLVSGVLLTFEGKKNASGALRDDGGFRVRIRDWVDGSGFTRRFSAVVASITSTKANVKFDSNAIWAPGVSCRWIYSGSVSHSR